MKDFPVTPMTHSETSFSEEKTTTPIRGVSFVAPPTPISTGVFSSVQEIHANWIAVIPYAFSSADKPEVIFNRERQWWGEKSEGIITTIILAKEAGLKVMLKPHVWVGGQGWAGDYTLANDKEWRIWERDYTQYIMAMARIADSLDVEILCIGTEFRQATRQRPIFWPTLAAAVRKQ